MIFLKRKRSSLRPLERQAKPGATCWLKGVSLDNCPFIK